VYTQTILVFATG